MPSYMIQLSYAPETLAAMIKKPQDRRVVIKKLTDQIGGKLVGSWLSFGEFDAVLVIEAPDNVSAAACSLVVSASGAFRRFQTTPLLSYDEGMAAAKKAAKIHYKPPTKK